jgi:hypothetical protein
MSDRKAGLFFIPTENLILDQYNPRLYGESVRDSQEAIMRKIYDREQIEELASSLSVNGYFEEEPIIVVPEKEVDFDAIASDNLSEFKFVVIEGNRRTTSVKLLLNDTDIVDADFPQIKSEAIRENLQTIPAIIYKKREEVDVYLSVRHISGNRKWDAFAKAKYIYEKVNKINERVSNLDTSIEQLSTQIGDQSNVVKKYYIYFKLFKEIEENVANYSSRHIKDRFSLLEVSLASGTTSIATYLGIPAFKNIKLDEDLIKLDKVDELQDVTGWIFGKDDNGTGRIISDSRQIGQYLKPILANREAIEHLKNYDDLAGAYELTSGEKEFIIGNFYKASKLVSNTLKRVDKFKDLAEFKAAHEDLMDTLATLNKILK